MDQKDQDAARAADEDSTRQRAGMLGVRYFDSRRIQRFPLFDGVLSNEEMYKHQAVIISREKGQMIIAITTKTPQSSLREFTDRFRDYQLSYVMISLAGFRDFMTRYDPPVEVQYEDIALKPGGNAEQLTDISKTLEEVKSDDIVEYLITQAARLQASDIHLEVGETQVRVRFRVDGVLHPVAYITPDKYRLIMSSIAALANISMSAPEPQQGHLEMRRPVDGGGEELLNMRIETVPTLYGQDAVIRLFTLNDDLLELPKLGLSADQSAAVDQVVAHPNGLVLAVGPTGSGKTTTLYAIMKALNEPTRKIITLEDPVEYSIEGIVQIPIKTAKEQTFGDVLRAVLRLDPDVVMVGEIRDPDTARTALQAALTGHLVLSTFHASDGPAAVARLVELIGENPLLASAVRLVIAQRLVRKLDDATKQPYKPSPDVAARIQEELKGLPRDLIGQDLGDLTLYRPGSSPEAPFGYVGQTAVVETLQVNEAIAHAMHNANDVDVEHIRQLASEAGMISMLQQGLIKALKGETSLEEVYRVVD